MRGFDQQSIEKLLEAHEEQEGRRALESFRRISRKPDVRPCEHEGCAELALSADGYDYCDKHVDHYYCECGQRLEDSYGQPGDGFCRRCG